MSKINTPLNQVEKSPLRASLAGVAKSTWEFLRSKAFWRFTGITGLITILIIFLLGVAFFLIFIGAIMTLVRISAVYRPAGRLFAKIAGLPEEKAFLQVSGPLWAKFLVTFPAIFYAILSCFGIWLLFKEGFLAQNLIYWLFFK